MEPANFWRDQFRMIRNTGDGSHPQHIHHPSAGTSTGRDTARLKRTTKRKAARKARY